MSGRTGVNLVGDSIRCTPSGWQHHDCEDMVEVIVLIVMLLMTSLVLNKLREHSMGLHNEFLDHLTTGNEDLQ